jgi:ABC-type transporter Mla MlaB component
MSFAARTGLSLRGKGGLLLAGSDDSPTTPARQDGEPATVELVLRGPIRRDDPALCARARALLNEGHAALVECDVGAVTEVDLGTVDALATLLLNARRAGSRVRLRDAPVELRELLAFAGLAEAVPCIAPLPVEPRGKAEEREEPRRVEEERDPADPAA